VEDDSFLDSHPFLNAADIDVVTRIAGEVDLKIPDVDVACIHSVV
jgi:hypothetical protein